MIGKFEITIPQKYVISMPDMEGNETNPDFSLLLDKYCNNIVRRGWKVWDNSNNLHAEVRSLIVDELLLIRQYSGTVKYFNPIVKVAELEIDSEIPIGLPNRTYTIIVDNTDPENPVTEEKVHTWRSWRSPNHPLGEVFEGFYYFISATYGKTLTCTELLIIHQSATATLVDTKPVIEVTEEL